MGAPRILALDCSSSIGWAVFDGPAARPRVNTYRLPAARELGARLTQWEAWLADMVHTYRPQVLAFEAPITWVIADKRGDPHATASQVRFLIGLTAVVEMVAYWESLRCIEVPIHVAKQTLAGDSRAKKPAMIAACVRRGWNVADDHQADAIAVGLAAFDHMGLGQ